MSAVSDYFSTGVNTGSGRFGADRGNGRKHRGQDWSHSTRPGTIPVPALLAGRVISKTAPSNGHGFGYGVTLRSVFEGEEYDISYSHGPWASQNNGDVAQGVVILHEGNSGATVGSCMHMEVYRRRTGTFIDPLAFARRVLASLSGGGSPAGGGGGGGSAIGATTRLKGQAWVLAIQDKYRRMGHDLGPSGLDGIDGPRFVEITKWEQSHAAGNGNPGGALVADGVAGDKTNAYLDWWLDVGSKPKPPTQSYPTVNYDNIASIGNVEGLQSIAKKNGYKGRIDNDWGGGSKAGFKAFIDRYYGGSIANWLRQKHGYSGNDQLGPQMTAALQRANAANRGK